MKNFPEIVLIENKINWAVSPFDLRKKKLYLLALLAAGAAAFLLDDALLAAML